MRYEDLVRLAQDREQCRVMTANFFKKTAPDADDDDVLRDTGVTDQEQERAMSIEIGYIYGQE